MRVCCVTPEDLPVPPVRGGSVQIYIHTLLQKFSQDTRSVNRIPNSVPEIVLLSPDKNRASGWRQSYADGIHHYSIRSKDKQDYRKQVLSQLRFMQPDVIQVENRPQFARHIRDQLQRPTITHLYSSTFLGPRHIPHNHVRKTLESMDAVVLISRYLRKVTIKEFGMKQSTWNPFVIYPGIDTNVFPVWERSVSEFSAQRPLKVLFVGRVISQKGVQVLVDAVKLLINAGYPVNLTIIGKTHPWEQAYENQVKRSAKGFPITFTGFVTPANLPAYYAEHDLFVCPSQYREAFGLVNLEAMSSGLPVIGSRVGGIEEILEKGAGILVDNVKSAESFRAAIAYFLQHPEALRAMSVAARKRAEQFTWNRTAQQFASLYETLAET